MVVIRDEERRGRIRLRLSASHDESSDNALTSLYGVLEDRHYIFVFSHRIQMELASIFSLFFDFNDLSQLM